MVKSLRNHIIERFGREPEDLDYVLNLFEPYVVKHGEMILQPGEVCQYVYFVCKGCLQVFVTDKQGNESTREFYIEDQWVTDIFGFQNQKPANEFIRCIEDADLMRIHYDSFKHLSQKVPAFALVYKEILELSYNNTVFRVNTLVSMDALGRIRWLMENKPRIMSRLTSKLVASYLGISPETLTRLKSKL